MIFKDFQEYVQSILKTEISAKIEQDGYFLETDFCEQICGKYNLTMSTIRVGVRKIYSEMGLIKRRTTNEIKRFYKLNTVTGNPIVYIKQEVSF